MIFVFLCDIISKSSEYAAMAQSVEHVIGNDEVISSILITSSKNDLNGSSGLFSFYFSFFFKAFKVIYIPKSKTIVPMSITYIIGASTLLSKK